MSLVDMIRRNKLATLATLAAPQSEKTAPSNVSTTHANQSTLATLATLAAPEIEKVTYELIERFKKPKPKPSILTDPKFEERRNKVKAMLDEKPDIQMTFVNDMDSNSNKVILTMAIRDQYTFEMHIPKDKYDAFLMLEILNKERQGKSLDELENQIKTV